MLEVVVYGEAHVKCTVRQMIARTAMAAARAGHECIRGCEAAGRSGGGVRRRAKKAGGVCPSRTCAIGAATRVSHYPKKLRRTWLGACPGKLPSRTASATQSRTDPELRT